jgi:uncharacterized protein (DUF427 family)
MTSPITARGRVRVETSAKRVRVYLNGQVIADTTSPMLVWEVPYYPTYYIPVEDLRDGVLTPTGRTIHSPSRGDGILHTVTVGDREAVDAAQRFEESPIEELRDLVRLDWDAMDAWFEEDEEVFTHARSPYARIDILPSSRHVRVEVGGVTVAESTHPYLLFETGLATRYYLPKTDVRLDLLEHTDTATHCPYKGQAEYWSVRVGDTLHEDVAWSYRTPLPESQRVAGLIAFWAEKPSVEIYVDGQPA